ncbi:FkbM family methyltransferase [Paenibacillus abyssi]|uniref:Methyltransferase FkbM domain-containing protein n=1 Tax=Paenibacillus abyssi TaxID=1340531 RepID=A0A917CNU9_9BACL|nr:FkbM family methyltransferase [Paenibacillus abyssi]GGF92308.1 hypothetical protein GCM10010916_07130 [Paenibacillus abyssi]
MSEITKSMNRNQDDSTKTNGANRHLVELQSYLEKMLESKENHPNNKALGSHRKIAGPFVTFIKRIIRKVLKWYIDPIVFQQIEFINAVTPAVGKSAELFSDLINKTDDLYNQLQQSLQMQQQYENRLTKMKQQQQSLSGEIDALVIQTDKPGVFDGIDPFSMSSYSQAGEDSIVDYIIRVLRIPYTEVTYIDLGANHAKNLSNTYFFYSKGSKGVLVEANPNLIPELKFFRDRDVVLNNCVDVETGKNVEFFILNIDGLSTTSYDAAVKMCETNPNVEIIDKMVVKTVSFNYIAEHYLGKAPTILSIDLEGKDMEILHSIDYTKYRPLVMIVEMIDYDTKLAYGTKNKDIKSFMESNDYDEYAFTGINSIFIDRNYLNGLIDDDKDVNDELSHK